MKKLNSIRIALLLILFIILTFSFGCAKYGIKSPFEKEKAPLESMPGVKKKPVSDLSLQYVKVGALNFRKCPSTRCRIIRVLFKGQGVIPQNSKNGWLEVTLEESGEKGWLAGKYLSKTKIKAAKPSQRKLAAPAPEPPPLEEEFATPATPSKAQEKLDK